MPTAPLASAVAAAADAPARAARVGTADVAVRRPIDFHGRVWRFDVCLTERGDHARFRGVRGGGVSERGSPSRFVGVSAGAVAAR
jgi:hypothetical protein